MPDEHTPAANRADTGAPGAAQATVFCSLEGANFPAAEFTTDPHWGQVHHTAQPHTTMGTFLDVEPEPVPNAPYVE